MTGNIFLQKYRTSEEKEKKNVLATRKKGDEKRMVTVINSMPMTRI